MYLLLFAKAGNRANRGGADSTNNLFIQPKGSAVRDLVQ
jgi:hypothetical protein